MTKNHFALIQKKKQHAQPCADDSLPDDEEIAPLGEIEQVKGEIDQEHAFCTNSEKNAQPCAEDSLPDDEEITPLGEIEQVKGEIDQEPFHTEFQTLAQSREEDMLPPSRAPFNPKCNNFIFTIISINLNVYTVHIHCYHGSLHCHGSFVEVNSLDLCCRHWRARSFKINNICNRCYM